MYMSKKWPLITVSAALVLSAACNGSDDSVTGEFEDDNLEAAVAEEAGKEADDLTTEDLEEITTLNAANADIQSIQGIQALANLEELSLSGNEIDDFTPLTELDNLESVHAGDLYLTEELDDTPWTVLEELEDEGVDVDARTRMSFEEYDDPSRGVFFEVEQGDQTVYLFGSVHVGDDTLYPLHDTIEEAFSEADHLAVEIDIADVDEAEAQQLMMSQAMYSDDTSLSDVIDDDVFEQAANHLSEFGLNEAMLEQFQPWFISMMLQDAALMQTDYVGDDGIDMYFLDRAHDEGLPVISLESMESQIESISSAPEEEQVASLEDMVRDFDIYGEELTQLINVWQAGNNDVFEYMRNIDQDAEQLALDERDVDMTEQIIDFLEEDSGDTYFVVVGALHLVGENSIAGLLEAEGYDVSVPDGYDE